ncbi:hypothetical protein PV326_002714 [Microctonus aethiopoides]|nr:hypothetical protein PV326_002714 [Microctonus aethiopoides]
MDFERHIRFVQYPLSLIGLWPENSPYTTVKFFVSVVLNVIGAIVNGRTLFFTGNNTDFMANMSYSLSFTLIIIKMYIMKKNIGAQMMMITWMDQNWECYKYLSEKSRNAMYKQTLKSTQMIIIVNVMIGFTLVSLLFGPVVEAFIKNTSIEKISKEGWFSFPVETTFSIAMLFLIRALSSTCGAIIWSGVDCWMILIVLHICGQMSILCNVIKDYKEFTKHTDNKFMNNGIQLHQCNCLTCIVDRHNSIFEICVTVENYINSIIFMKLIVQSAQICTVGILIIRNKTNIMSMVATNLGYFTAVIWTTFIYGWLGEQLTQHGYAIGDAIYSNNWYEYHQRKLRQTLSIIICRAQRPIRITAGKYFSMSLNSVTQHHRPTEWDTEISIQTTKCKVTI